MKIAVVSLLEREAPIENYPIKHSAVHNLALFPMAYVNTVAACKGLNDMLF